jgi:hypothetical protein
MTTEELEINFPKVFDLFKLNSRGNIEANIIDSFNWGTTIEGHHFWAEMHYSEVDTVREFLEAKYPDLLTEDIIKYKGVIIQKNIFK